MDNIQKKRYGTSAKICIIFIFVAIAIVLLIQPGGKRIRSQEMAEKSEVCIINFDCWLKYVVSEASPDIELTNPAENTVYFVFEIIDDNSDELIARTDKVAPGKHTCVRVADFYSKPGRYYATLTVSAYDIETNIQKKGLKQGIEIEFGEDARK